MLRSEEQLSAAQAQSGDAFAYKWKQRDTFESSVSLARMRTWLRERYGDVAGADWWQDYGDQPVVLDAGCGAAMSARELFDGLFDRIHYIGADVARAVDIAADRFASRNQPAAFVQADLNALPLPEACCDVIFSEGVLHHTDSTEQALKSVVRYLKIGGRILFYVYRLKGPIREFTDDYIREQLQQMVPEEAWTALKPLTRLGWALGELDVEIDVPEDIALLEIPAGRISLQRLFYWHIFKAYHHPDLSIEECNHINFDWFAPQNAHRQTPEDVRRWCDEAGLDVEREVVEQAGITIIARKREVI
ncbi:MAG: class I SAM-dependent methyltransferase [Proteobacteria bacterium]|nr:class I SAM-dependent methyltransferase [Pseudomonadota bacterium]